MTKACRKWLLLLSFGILLCLMIAGLFNLVVDPYDIYRVIRIEGFNDNKHLATSHARMSKSRLLRVIEPKGLILGTSRAEVGLDPDHPGWSAAARPVFNFALGGAPMVEIEDRLAQAIEVSSPKQVVLGLDFFMFNVYKKNPARKMKEKSLPMIWLTTLFSVDALADSLESLRKQDPIRRPGVLPNGQISWDFHTYRVAKFGHRKDFERHAIHYFSDNLYPKPEKEFALENEQYARRSFEALRRTLELAGEHDIDLKLYISPAHVTILEIYEQSNLWTLLEEWKRGLVEVVEDYNRAHPDRSPLVLWDFSGVNSVTTEEVPLSGDTESKMQWYWEASHFKTATGHLILDRLFGTSHEGRVLPEDFGVRLTSTSLDRHLAATRIGMQLWREQHQEIVYELHKIGRGSKWRKSKYRRETPEGPDRDAG